MAHLEAPAKLTLSLRITGVRADGFHLIDAEMVTLDLADTLVVEEAAETGVSVDGPFAAGVPTDRITLVVPTTSAMGPTTMIGTKLATETSMLRTPNTRPRTDAGRSSWSWVWLEIATIP